MQNHYLQKSTGPHLVHTPAVPRHTASLLTRHCRHLNLLWHAGSRVQGPGRGPGSRPGPGWVQAGSRPGPGDGRRCIYPLTPSELQHEAAVAPSLRCPRVMDSGHLHHFLGADQTCRRCLAIPYMVTCSNRHNTKTKIDNVTLGHGALGACQESML